MKREDFVQAPCSCPECVQAGVHELEQIRDRTTGQWLHGYALKRWHAAAAEFSAKVKAIMERKSPKKPSGFTKFGR